MQRAEKRERKDKGDGWAPRYFRQLGAGEASTLPGECPADKVPFYQWTGEGFNRDRRPVEKPGGWRPRAAAAAAAAGGTLRAARHRLRAAARDPRMPRAPRAPRALSPALTAPAPLPPAAPAEEVQGKGFNPWQYPAIHKEL
jgi:hypothetical protein